MATLTSNQVAASVQAKETNQNLVAVVGSYTLTAALALNDVIQMVKVPAGAQILGMQLVAEDLDTGGSPAIVLDVGDGGDTDRFIDGSTIAQTGGSAVLGAGVAAAAAIGAFGYVYTVDDTIDVLVQVAPATGATAGTIKLVVWYHSDVAS